MPGSDDPSRSFFSSWKNQAERKGSARVRSEDISSCCSLHFCVRAFSRSFCVSFSHAIVFRWETFHRLLTSEEATRRKMEEEEEERRQQQQLGRQWREEKFEGRNGEAPSATEFPRPQKKREKKRERERERKRNTSSIYICVFINGSIEEKKKKGLELLTFLCEALITQASHQPTGPLYLTAPRWRTWWFSFCFQLPSPNPHLSSPTPEICENGRGRKAEWVFFWRFFISSFFSVFWCVCDVGGYPPRAFTHTHTHTHTHTKPKTAAKVSLLRVRKLTD